MNSNQLTPLLPLWSYSASSDRKTMPLKPAIYSSYVCQLFLTHAHSLFTCCHCSALSILTPAAQISWSPLSNKHTETMTRLANHLAAVSFKCDCLSTFSSFMLLSRTPPPPHLRPVSTDPSASSTHHSISSSPPGLDSMGGSISLLIGAVGPQFQISPQSPSAKDTETSSFHIIC